MQLKSQVGRPNVKYYAHSSVEIDDTILNQNLHKRGLRDSVASHLEGSRIGSQGP